MKKHSENITMEEFNGVLDKISGWVGAAVKEVFVPALQRSMEQKLLSSEMPSISSSPQRGETSTSPSERISQSQRDVFSSASAGSPCSLPLMATSPFRSSRKPLQNEASKPLMELRSGLKFMSTLRCSDLNTAPPCEPLRTLFGITKESIFQNVHKEVTSSLCNMTLPRMTDTPSMKTTSKLASTILDQSLIQLNSALTEAYNRADSHEGLLFIASTSKDVAHKLLVIADTKMQDFFHLCTVSDWLSSQGSPVNNIHDKLEEMLPLATVKVVATIFNNMLNVCSEASSEDSEDSGSKSPLFNFIKAVHDKIKSELFKAATLRGSSGGSCSSIGRKSPSSPVSSSATSSQKSWTPKAGQAVLWLNDENDQGTTVEDLPVNLVSLIGAKVPEVTSSVIYQSLQLEDYMRLKPPRERVLETIIFSMNDDDDDPPASEINTKRLFRLSCEAFRVEASKMVSDIILNETAEIDMRTEASRRSQSSVERGDQSPLSAFKSNLGSSTLATASTVVSAVTAELKSTFEEELRLVDPSADLTLYMEQVQMVSEKVLNSIQATLKNVFVQNLLMRADAAMTKHDRAALSYKILSGSKKVVKSIIQNITAAVPLSAVSDSVKAITQQFLESIEVEIELQFMWQLSDSSLTRPECFSDLIVTEVSEIVADKLLSNGALQQNESSDSSLETLDNILSTDSIHQSSNELIPLVQNLVLKGSAALNTVMEKTSSPCDDKVISTPELCKTSKHHRILPFKLPKFRSLKLKFKKLRKKVEPMSAPSSDCTQKRPDLTVLQTASSFCPPADEPSTSLATRTSTAVPVPKRKSFFSRVATAFSKVFRKESQTSA